MKRVLLIHPEGNSFNNPTLKSVIDLLLDHKVNIDLRYFNTGVPMPPISGISLLPFGRIYKKFKSLIFNKLCSAQLSWISVWFERVFVYGKYDLVIGVDREGLIEADLLCRMTRTPYVFFSFEIMFESETSVEFKALERRAAKLVQNWFVQDEIRAVQLQRENELDQTKRMLLPLASSGKGVTGGDRLRDRLGIPLEKKVVLAMGSLSAWSMTREIVTSVSTWPDDWVLIMHDRYGHTAEALGAIGLASSELPKDKVYCSSQASAMVDNMGEILAGVSAGLAFYRPDYSGPYTGKNLKYLGLASGKISTFLRYGVPPIMNEIGTYSDLAREHGFGLVAGDASDLGNLLPLLADSTWGESARRFHEEYLDFENFQGAVWEKLIDAQSKPVLTNEISN